MARWQLLKAGFSRHQVDRLLAAGALRVVHRGVYALAYRDLDRPALHHAGALAIGVGSTISHADAAAEWRVRPEPSGPVHLTLPADAGGRARRRGIVLHRVPLLDGDWVHHGQLRITSPARTLLDLAASLPTRALERALDEAHYRELISRRSLAETLTRNRGRRGVPILRRVLDGHELGTTRTESELEERFVGAYRAHGRFPFRCQEPLAPYRADLVFEAQRVVVEVDGPAHRRKRRRASDAVRDAVLGDRGFHTLRVTDEEMDTDIEAAVARVDRELVRVCRAGRCKPA